MNVSLSKKFLYDEYIKKKKSTYQIASEVRCSNTTIRNKLIKYKIPRRDGSESHKGQHSSPKTEFKKGKKPWNFKGEIKRNGYIIIHIPNHPYSSAQGYVRKHRLAIETEINRYLTPKESVHHINEIKADNRIKNLIAFTSESTHQRFHKNKDNIKLKEIIFDGRLI